MSPVLHLIHNLVGAIEHFLHAYACVSRNTTHLNGSATRVVRLWRDCHLLEHAAGTRQVVAELKQLQALAGIDAITLGCRR